MPPKLTSKNIFDAVFSQIPADAFIDTGPASWKEELMLEAAGMSAGDAGSRGGTNGGSSGNGGGPGHFRRYVLPSSSIAAAVVASSAKAGPDVSASSDARKDNAGKDDLLSGAAEVGEATEDGVSSPAPPAYNEAGGVGPAATQRSRDEGGGGSLFRRMEDDVSRSGGGSRLMSGRAAAAVLRRNAPTRRKAGTRIGQPDPVEEGEFAVQMDDEDEAVKEATKYASLLAEARAATGESGGSAAVDGSLNAIEAVERSRVKAAESSAVVRGALASTAPLATASGDATSGVAANASILHAGGLLVTGETRPTSTASAGMLASAAGTAFPNALAVPARGGPLSAAEQLALMPPGLDCVYTGACVMYRHPKGFGFLSPDLGGPDVYFINDGITLSFTKLALRAFYRMQSSPVPAAVEAAYRAPVETIEAEQETEDAKVEKNHGDDATGRLADDAKKEVVEAVQNASAEAEARHAALATVDTAPSPAESTAVPPPASLTVSQAVASEGTMPATSQAATSERTAAAAVPFPAVVALDMGDRVSVPATTPDELAHAEEAAALLTPATAQLLQCQVDQGFGGGVRVGERMSFVVTRNHTGRGGNGRLLRAEFVRGVPAALYAMPVEQSWFAGLFPGAVSRKTSFAGHDASSLHPSLAKARAARSEEGTIAPALDADGSPVHPPSSSSLPAEGPADATAPSMLARYTGCVRTYDPEDQRGYLRCDESDSASSAGNTPDVVFYAHAVLWNTVRCPPLKRQVKESMRVAYSVCGTERNGKYIATLITTPSGEPFTEENMSFAENVLPFYMSENGRRRGRDDMMLMGQYNMRGMMMNSMSANASNAAGGVMSGSGGGRAMTGGNAGAVAGSAGGDAGLGSGGQNVSEGLAGGGDRKRAKTAEEDLLLFEEEDYLYM